MADPEFSEGASTPKVGVLTYHFAIFCQKLHENERIWTPSGVPPWIHQQTLGWNPHPPPQSGKIRNFLLEHHVPFTEVFSAKDQTKQCLEIIMLTCATDRVIVRVTVRVMVRARFGCDRDDSGVTVMIRV